MGRQSRLPWPPQKKQHADLGLAGRSALVLLFRPGLLFLCYITEDGDGHGGPARRLVSEPARRRVWPLSLRSGPCWIKTEASPPGAAAASQAQRPKHCFRDFGLLVWATTCSTETCGANLGAKRPPRSVGCPRPSVRQRRSTRNCLPHVWPPRDPGGGANEEEPRSAICCAPLWISPPHVTRRRR